MKYGKGTLDFFERVYSVVKQVPYGHVTTYGAIAKYLGNSRSSRVVGWAMNASHNRPDIPSHRVVNRIGMLTGKHHFGATHLMQKLLENENITIEEDQVINFKEKFWDPSENL